MKFSKIKPTESKGMMPTHTVKLVKWQLHKSLRFFATNQIVTVVEDKDHVAFTNCCHPKIMG